MLFMALVVLGFVLTAALGELFAPDSKRAGIFAPLFVTTLYVVIAWARLRVLRRRILLSLADPIPNERCPGPANRDA